MSKPKVAVFTVVIAAIVGFTLVRLHNAQHASLASNSTSSTSDTGLSTPGFSKSQYSLTDPTSIWVIVNKQHPLNPIDYVPPDLTVPNVPLRVPGNETMQLRTVTSSALETMFTAAKNQGVSLMLASGYRSYSYQVSLYNGYVQTQGQATADTQSARPGYSEHQTGFAADIEPISRNCELEQCFANTPEGEWLASNCYLYGFIIRYTAGNQTVTGYEPEPWHIRYVGVALAKELHATHVDTLEQFFNVTGGTTYKNPS